MNPQNNQKILISAWRVAKLFWLAQALSSLSFGMPLVAMTLFAANIASPVIWQTVLFYFVVSLFVFVPFNGVLSFVFLKPIKKILNEIYEKKGATTEEGLRIIGRLFNLPIHLSSISFIASFLGFLFGLSLLWLGLIPGLKDLIVTIVALGLAIGFVTCLIQSSLVYIFLESYSRPQIELLNRFYPEVIKKIKIRKFPIFWKVFFLALSSIIVAQVSLGALYLGRVKIYSSEDLQSALIYVGVVLVSTLFYVVTIAFLASRNLVYPIKKIISWSDKIIKRETEEEIYLTTNDEVAELIEYLKKMHQEVEETKASLEIKIRARTRELKDLTDRQEEIIKDRTEEIQERVEELEKFRRLSVGRELKMIELKKEISRLKEILEKKGK